MGFFLIDGNRMDFDTHVGRLRVMSAASRFLSELDVRKDGQRTWKLLADLAFYSDDTSHGAGVYVAPRGSITNFASIPRIGWVIWPPVDNYDWAAVIHDTGYNCGLRTQHGQPTHPIKARCDDLFYEGMLAMRVPRHRAKFMYGMVKLFGTMTPCASRPSPPDKEAA